MSINLSLRVVVSILAIFTFSGCSAKYYINGGKAFNKSVDAGTEVIKDDLGAITKTSRILSLEYYLAHQAPADEVAISNKDAATQDASFVYFVCAGSDKYLDIRGRIQELTTYRDVLDGLTGTPSDSISKLWIAINKLSENTEPLRPPQSKPTAFNDCKENVKTMVPPKGTVISKGSARGHEFAAIALTAIPALIEGLKTIAVDILQMTQENKEASAIRVYVTNERNTKEMKALFDALLSQESVPNSPPRTLIDTLFEERLQAALVLPYHEFMTIFALPLDNVNHKRDVIVTGVKVHENLSTFDTLHGRKKPSDIVLALQKAHTTLVNLAENKGTGPSLADYLAEIDGYSKLLKDVADEAKKANDTFGTKPKTK